MKKLLPVLVIFIFLTACAPVQSATHVQRNVFYAGSDGGLKTALSLAGYTLVNDPAQADVFVLNGQIPQGVAEQVRGGKGLVLILGKDMTQNDVQDLLGQPVTLTYTENAVSLINAKGAHDVLLTEII
jgi:hypothetical protein